MVILLPVYTTFECKQCSPIPASFNVPLWPIYQLTPKIDPKDTKDSYLRKSDMGSAGKCLPGGTFVWLWVRSRGASRRCLRLGIVIPATFRYSPPSISS